MKSASSSGPIGWFAPSFIAMSIDCTLIIGIRMRFTMKAGKSSAEAAVLPSFATIASIV